MRHNLTECLDSYISRLAKPVLTESTITTKHEDLDATADVTIDELKAELTECGEDCIDCDEDLTEDTAEFSDVDDDIEESIFDKFRKKSSFDKMKQDREAKLHEIETTDYDSDFDGDHNYMLITVDDNGNFDSIVTKYMTREDAEAEAARSNGVGKVKYKAVKM